MEGFIWGKWIFFSRRNRGDGTLNLCSGLFSSRTFYNNTRKRFLWRMALVCTKGFPVLFLMDCLRPWHLEHSCGHVRPAPLTLVPSPRTLFSCLDFIPLVFIVRELLLCFTPGHIFCSQNLECMPQPSLLCSLQLSFFALWSIRPWCHTDLHSQHLKFYTGFRNGHSKAALVTTASLLSSGWVSRAQRHGVFRRSY